MPNKIFAVYLLSTFLVFAGCSDRWVSNSHRSSVDFNDFPRIGDSVLTVFFEGHESLGTAFCIGDGVFLSAAHVAPTDRGENTAAFLGGLRIRPKVLGSGDRRARNYSREDAAQRGLHHDQVTGEDWIAFYADLAPLPATTIRYEPDRELEIGQDAWIFGYPDHDVLQNREPNENGVLTLSPRDLMRSPLVGVSAQIVELPSAVVESPQFAAMDLPASMLWLELDTNRRALNGMSGGPVVIRDERGDIVSVAVVVAGVHLSKRGGLFSKIDRFYAGALRAPIPRDHKNRADTE